METKTPELDKMLAVKDKSQAIGEFLRRRLFRISLLSFSALSRSIPKNSASNFSVAKFIARTFDLPFDHGYNEFNPHIYNRLLEVCSKC